MIPDFETSFCSSREDVLGVQCLKGQYQVDMSFGVSLLRELNLMFRISFFVVSCGLSRVAWKPSDWEILMDFKK